MKKDKKSEVQIFLEGKIDGHMLQHEMQVKNAEIDSKNKDLQIQDIKVKNLCSAMSLEKNKLEVELARKQAEVVELVATNRAVKKTQIGTDDVDAAPGTYDQNHLNDIVNLLNELKAKINEMNN